MLRNIHSIRRISNKPLISWRTVRGTHDDGTLIHRVMDLKKIDTDLFVQNHQNLYKPSGKARAVFGGQLAGTAMHAAQLSSSLPIHSIQCMFLLPGQKDRDIVYTVDRLRDGRSFETRRVTASQDGKAIFHLTSSHHHPEITPELEYYEPLSFDLKNLPDLSNPTTIRSVYRKLADNPEISTEVREFALDQLDSLFPFDFFALESKDIIGSLPQFHYVFVKAREKYSFTDFNTLIRSLTFFSDMFVADATLSKHNMSFIGNNRHKVTMVASLDHHVRFHIDPCSLMLPNLHDYFIFELQSTVTSNSIGMNQGRIWSTSGQLLCSVQQETLYRTKNTTKLPFLPVEN